MTAAGSVETVRLNLAPVTPADADALCHFFRDAHVRRYMLDGALVDRAWVTREIDASRERIATGDFGLYAARPRGTEELVGVTGFRPDHDPPILELVYALLPAYCGRGLATEMARAMTDLAFDRGRQHVDAAVDAPNGDSFRVLERLGFVAVRESPGAFGHMIHLRLRATSRSP